MTGAKLSLDGRTALVTGSSRNLGAAIAERLARAGAVVALTYHSSRDEAETLAARLREETGRDHIVVGGDLAASTGVEAVVGGALAAFGRVDVLVNNAGPFSMTPFIELPEHEWDTIWDTNAKAVYLATRLVVPGMRETGWGRIVNISAGSAYLRNHSVYTLAKAALNVLTEELALELGPEITVNALAPGQIAESADDITELDPTFVERTLEHTPAGRLVTRGEVAELVALLCSPPFDMVTGETLAVDGGWRFNRF